VARVTDERQSLDGGTQWRSRVLSPELCRRLRSMLEDVVTDGTGEGARVRGYRVAGKTGTAQQATNGAFDDIHHMAWFAGFFPQPDPRIVVVVAVKDPAAEIWGSTVAAPVFARIAQATLIQIGLPPSEPMTDPEPGGSV
jgi:cell division protein FtsI/penicillin-binding protein 2